MTAKLNKITLAIFMINKEYQIPNDWNIVLVFERPQNKIIKSLYIKKKKNQHNKKVLVAILGKVDNYLNNKKTCHNIFKLSFLHLLHP